MSVDTTLLGETAAECMETLAERFDDEHAELVAVGIVVVAETDDMTWTRTFCSRHYFFEQIGLFEAAKDVIQEPEER